MAKKDCAIEIMEILSKGGMQAPETLVRETVKQVTKLRADIGAEEALLFAQETLDRMGQEQVAQRITAPLQARVHAMKHALAVQENVRTFQKLERDRKQWLEERGVTEYSVFDTFMHYLGAGNETFPGARSGLGQYVRAASEEFQNYLTALLYTDENKLKINDNALVSGALSDLDSLLTTGGGKDTTGLAGPMFQILKPLIARARKAGAYMPEDAVSILSRRTLRRETLTQIGREQFIEAAQGINYKWEKFGLDAPATQDELVKYFGDVWDRVTTGTTETSLSPEIYDTAVALKETYRNNALEISLPPALPYASVEDMLAGLEMFNDITPYELFEDTVLQVSEKIGAMEFTGSPFPRRVIDDVIAHLKQQYKNDPVQLDRLDSGIFTETVEAWKRAQGAGEKVVAAAKAGKKMFERATFIPSLGALADTLTGDVNRHGNFTAAHVMREIRAASLLGTLAESGITSIIDISTQMASSVGQRGVSPLTALVDGVQARIASLTNSMRPWERELFLQIGGGGDLMREGLSSHVSVNEIGRGKMSVLTSWQMKVNGLKAMDIGARFSAARMSSIVLANTIENINDLRPYDTQILEAYGLDAGRLREIPVKEMPDGRIYVFPETIEDPQLRQDVHRYLVDTVYTWGGIPTQKTRASVTKGSAAGTFSGEILRFMGGLKTYPYNLANTVVPRMYYGPEAAGSLITFVGSALVLAAISKSIKDVLRGRTPVDYTQNPEALLELIRYSGMAGFYSDFLFHPYGSYGGGLPDMLAGPVVGMVGEGLGVGAGLTQDVFSGEGVSPGTVKAGIRAGERLLPGVAGALIPSSHIGVAKWGVTLVGNPVTKNLIHNTITNSLLELAEPGYIERMNQQRQAKYGQQPLF